MRKNQPKRQKSKNKSFPLDLENIQRKVALGIKDKTVKTLGDLRLFLVRWWCNYYKKPYRSCETLKDLDNYTLEELIIEYFDVFFRNNPKELEKFLSGETKQVVEEAEEDEDWLKKQMGQEYVSVEEQEVVLKQFEQDIKEAKGDNKNKLTNSGFVDLEEFKD